MKLVALEGFLLWLEGLRDDRARKRIAQRFERVGHGLLGDVKGVGGGVSELRIDHGPGYRVYFARRGDIVIVLLNGGDKSSQQRDILKAKTLWAEWERDHGTENDALR